MYLLAQRLVSINRKCSD